MGLLQSCYVAVVSCPFRSCPSAVVSPPVSLDLEQFSESSEASVPAVVVFLSPFALSLHLMLRSHS